MENLAYRDDFGDFYKLKFAELRSPPGSLAKVINERLQSCMQIITLMLSAIIIYPSHQFVSVFSLRHVGPATLVVQKTSN